jgi:hypothetical protein
MPLLPLDLDAGVTIGASDHPLRNSNDHPFAHGRRHRHDQSPPNRGQAGHRPIRGVLPGAGSNQMIRRPLESEKAEHCGQWRQPNPPLAQTRRMQPGFVKFEPHWE